MTQQPATTQQSEPSSGQDATGTGADLPEQMKVRAQKRADLLAGGGSAYPVQVPRTHSLRQVRDQWGHLQTGEETDDVVSVAGRVVFSRNTGKLCFGTLQSGEGERLQVMLSLAEVGQQFLDQWKSVVDLGDFVSVTGRVISSRRGELSVMATRWEMASKALRPLPILFRDLSEEQRVRQRYADLIVRDEARQMVRTRAIVLSTIRRFLEEAGYTEIETPVLQLIHGGAHARPFRTHLNAFDQPMTLRIALELNLKKAVVGGIERVFEIGRTFRNEGVDSTHSPEFTMLEAYQAWGDQASMAELMRQMYLAVADALIAAGLLESRVISTPAGDIDLGAQWTWLPVYQGVSQAVGRTVTPETSVAELREIAAEHAVNVAPEAGAEKIILELLDDLVEPTLIQPTFLCDYPPSAQPLARPHRSKPGVIEAWDLIIGGIERSTAFSELIDPVLQRQVLTEQSRQAAAGDPEAMQLDEDFLRALEYGAPPMGGLGFGVDRMLMLFTGAGIRETILFPHTRPEA